MKFDGTDVVRARMFYKDHTYRVDGVDVKHKVFVDWAESYVEDYVVLGSPFQVSGNGFAPRGAFVADLPLLFVEEHIDTSLPQDSQTASVSIPNGPVHYKPGVNI